MSASQRTQPLANALLCVLLTCALSFALWFTLYFYDNKYTAQFPKAANGVLTLDEGALDGSAPIFLVDGWEYYAHTLLTPADFVGNPPALTDYIFIGRFGGFEGADKTASPHGSASYRLRINLPAQPRIYTLELPEIFSAYRLYVNGKLAYNMGEVEPAHYRPETGNRLLSIELGGSAELLFAVSDYSHLYSGIVYPPAFGTLAQVSMLLNVRMVFRTALCVAALTIGGLAVLVGLLSRGYASTLLHGLLCILFVGYVSYPIMQTFFSGFSAKYIVENFSFCAMLALICLLAGRSCQIKTPWLLAIVCLGAGMCLLCISAPALWGRHSLQLMRAYSFAVSGYEYLCALFLSLSVAVGLKKNVLHTMPLLVGILIFDTALLADRMLPLYEPMVTGWFIELASFALVICIGVMVGQRVASHYRQSGILTARTASMQQLYKSQQSYYALLREKIQQSERMQHDMRHHFTAIHGYIKNQQYQRLSDYVQEYTALEPQDKLPDYCEIDVINLLSHHYASLCAQSDITLDIRCDLSQAGEQANATAMADADLCALYANLLENSVEGCQRMTRGRRYIYVAIVRPAQNILMLRIWNSTDDKLRPSGDSFLSAKRGEQCGYGLLSIRTVAQRYGGTASFHWDKDKCEFESRITLNA